MLSVFIFSSSIHAADLSTSYQIVDTTLLDKSEKFIGKTEGKLFTAWFEDNKLFYSISNDDYSLFSTPEVLMEIPSKSFSEKIGDIKIEDDIISIVLISDLSARFFKFKNNYLLDSATLFTDGKSFARAAFIQPDLIALSQDDKLGIYSQDFTKLVDLPLGPNAALLDSLSTDKTVLILKETIFTGDSYIKYLFLSENDGKLIASSPTILEVKSLKLPVNISEEPAELEIFAFDPPAISMPNISEIAQNKVFTTKLISFEVENTALAPIEVKLSVSPKTDFSISEISSFEIINTNCKTSFALNVLEENQNYYLKAEVSNGFASQSYPVVYTFSIDSLPPSLEASSNYTFNVGENEVILTFSEGISEYDALSLFLDEAECYINDKVIEDKKLSLRFKIFDPIEEGPHVLKLAGIKDLAGNENQNISSTVIIDKTAPIIQVFYPENDTTIVDTNYITIGGSINEINSSLIINNAIAIVDSTGKFDKICSLSQGLNKLNLVATDEAGNTTQHQLSISFYPPYPVITILSPSGESYVGSGQILFVELEVADYQDDLEDESEIQISSPAAPELDGAIYYDKESGKASGMILIPEDSPFGKLPINLKVADQSGNIGETSLSLFLDNQPPSPKEAFLGNHGYSNKHETINLAATDEGSGIDLAGSLIDVTLDGASVEGHATFTNIELQFIPFMPLAEGSYEVTATLRDLAGNISDPYNFTLNIDLTPPEVEIDLPENINIDEEEYTLNFFARGDDIDTISIFSNGKIASSFSPSGSDNSYAQVIKLDKGSNQVELRAEDYAGNLAFDTVNIFADIAGISASTISNLQYGPNPFNPDSESYLILFDASISSNVVLYIFNQGGEIIFKNTYTANGKTAIPWDGANQFSRKVANGVYTFILKSTGAASQVEKGKIIVLR
ncbi:MAG: hypothetical protein KKB81_01125 [Candidatus Margulisbacteria bacterium]|nr:hypothetical protein [Candidatus Margulisiibacteriota bacterium]MBU1021112.1 hypothetical protein [Candidatus Margulisiibacteriota bacterium]MBU1728667.1 hypothetical protein [Candidatus Margulisiibacteriota bacterium]MBU1955118.1 hypothetical protein [Candidatus Margulisiibacteriota bacterium]